MLLDDLRQQRRQIDRLQLQPCLARFAPGDSVRVADIRPPGHTRTPLYIRGKTGEIERICGDFRNPEALAYGEDGLPKQTLYRVRFDQTHVWPDYAGPPHDKVEIEIYEHWLEPASGEATP